ncbi:MAG: glycosyltransferase [Verrucomicrobia bacterium]|nr:glycosyltransferase [Verrucomicrobiota bacterium]
MLPSEPAPALSVVIPFHNEAANIAPLLAELRETLDTLSLSTEIICIDDGSRDATAAELSAAARAWPAVRIETFPQNRGQAAALWHGFHLARGAYVAMLDGDGQNPPAELARLWPLRDSADLISGARAGRQDSALRLAMSRVANTVRRTLLCDGVTDTGCSLKLFRREVVGSFLPIRTLYSFIPAFAVSAGFTVREIPVAHRPRRAGTSHYGLRVMAVHPLLDLLSLTWLLRRTLCRKE